MLASLNGKLIPYKTICEDAQLNRDRSQMGLIETMLYKNGEIPLWKFHYQRLINSFSSLGKQYVVSLEEQLLSWINNLIKENGIQTNCILRIEYFFNENQSHFLIETKNLPEISISADSKKRVGIASSVVLSPDNYSSLKTTFRLAYEKAQLEAKKNNWYDALLLNAENRIVESTISNIFWIKNGKIFTPPISEGCVAGVFRTFLMLQFKTEIQEKVLDMDTLKDADEVFLTNAVRGIQAISYFEEKQYSIELVKHLIK